MMCKALKVWSNIYLYRDLLEQAQIVVDRMKATNSSVSDTAMDFDFETSWKLMTILIGGNDMCDFCTDRVEICDHFHFIHICFTI